MTIDQEDPKIVREQVAELALSYPVGLASEDVQQAFGGVRALPTALLLDQQGQIRRAYEGVTPTSALKADIEYLLTGAAL